MELVPDATLNLINRILEAIKQRLLPLQELGVALKDEPDQGSGKPVPKGAVQFFHVGSSFTRPGDGEIYQLRELQFLIAIYMRDLRTHADIYPVEQAVWHLLTGWQPMDCLWPGRLYPVESQLQPERSDAGYWISDLVVGMKIQHEGVE